MNNISCSPALIVLSGVYFKSCPLETGIDSNPTETGIVTNPIETNSPGLLLAGNFLSNS